MPERYISRRQFLKDAALMTAGLGGAVICSKINEPIVDMVMENSLENLTISPRYPLPQELKGLLINSPFLWRHCQAQSSVISQSVEVGASNLRMFANDTIEPGLGDYKHGLVAAIRDINNIIASQDNNLHTVVSLYDAYGMKERSNLIYGSNTVTSPYSDGSEVGYRSFFTDKNIRRFFMNRIKMLIESLGDSSVISAWEVGNEFERPKGDKEGKIFQDWFFEAVDTIRQIDKVRPILTGVKNPQDLDEKKLKNKNVINTVHLYSLSSISDFHAFLQSEEHQLPLMVEEAGFPGRFIGVDFPTLVTDIGYNNFLHKIIRAATSSGNLLIDSLGLWKIDGYDDGFPNPLELSLTHETITKFVSLVKNYI